MLGTSIWWIVDAHKWFKGPKASFPYSNLGEFKLIFGDQVNIEHQMLGREDSVQGSSSGSVENLKEIEAGGGVKDTTVR